MAKKRKLKKPSRVRVYRKRNIPLRRGKVKTRKPQPVSRVKVKRKPPGKAKVSPVKRKPVTAALKKKRKLSNAAKRGWETRRKNERAKKRKRLTVRRKPKPKPKKRPKKELELLYNADEPHFLFPENIASEDSDETYLLYYKDGKKININIRLQFEGNTVVDNFNIFSQSDLYERLLEFLRDNRKAMSDEINKLKNRGINVSFLVFRCSAYAPGKNTHAKLIEILYP